MPDLKPSIAIIGAGIGGLTAAAALRKVGVPAVIYEQAEAFQRIGAGIQVASNPMKVLRWLGLEDRLRRTAFQPMSRRSRDSDTGHLRYEFDMGTVENAYGAPHLVMHRGDLHAALNSVVPRDIISFGHKLAGLEQDSEGALLRFVNGAEARHPAVIGADGIHSVVRQVLFGSERPTYTGRIAYRATFPTERLGDLSLGDGTTKWWGPDRHIVIYYITANRDEAYFTTSVPAEVPDLESWSLKGDLAELRAAFSAFHPNVRRVLDACPETNKWPIFDREPMKDWGSGRVYLLGDACHPMTPYMAQGAATAIEDAAVLARCMEGLELRNAVAGFRRYENTRKKRASSIQSISHKNRRDWMRVDEANPDSPLRDDAAPHWVFGYDATTAPLADSELAIS
jgi:salicylate hydroxylase/6-hydroxynicotinate 3-monooxygenase